MSQYPYKTLNEYYRETFGSKVAKIALDGGFTCPNRDGTLGYGGCIFCSVEGSGDFAQDAKLSIAEQIEQGKKMMNQKWVGLLYIAYFQAFTNTYAPISVLREKYEEAIEQEDIVGLSIATRPDCLGEDVLNLLEEFSKKTTLYVELGLQTANDQTADFIHRGYDTSVFEEAVWELAKRDIMIVVHVILGLPNETEEDIFETISFLNQLPIQGVKLQMMHIIEGTELAKLYEQGAYIPLEQEAYIDLVAECVMRLREDIVVHRFTGDGKQETLIAPLWSLKKGEIMNQFHQKLKYENLYQGKKYKE